MSASSHNMAQLLIKGSSRKIHKAVQDKGRFIFRVFITTCLCFVFFVGMIVNIETLKNDINKKDKVKNLLDGCYHVYIDVGTNVGIQIRKLFEPEKYPDANVHQVFDIKFGNVTERLQQTIDGGSILNQ